MRQRLFRLWNIAIVVLVALVVPTNVVLAWQEETGMFATPLDRALNTLCFFTILSNSLVGYVSYMLFKGKSAASGFAIARHTALVCITVTSIVYHVLIAGTHELTGLNVITDIFLHTVIPLLYVIGWFVYGPRGLSSWTVAWKSLLFPIGWAIFAMIRGAIVGYYPYEFMDVRDLGYAQTLITMGFVTVFFVILTVLYRSIDRVLTKS